MSEELARRAVACKHWRWLPGMRAVGRRRMPAAWFRVEEYTQMVGEWRDAVPDLSDPATVGALLALVREAGAYIRHLSMLPMGCTVNVAWPDGRICDYRRETLAEALVAALEAAP